MSNFIMNSMNMKLNFQNKTQVGEREKEQQNIRVRGEKNTPNVS